ncbi:hypothetical protein QP175_01585 [Sphingomonas aerolata]|uniref:hypothetical protein n=1 Tax=Sphingomonas aerolata TaxID=185951 RepID=UPI002FE324F0
MVEDRPHRRADRRIADRRAVEDVGGRLRGEGRRGLSLAAPSSGRGTSVTARANPSNSAGRAARIVTARPAGNASMIAIARLAWPRP